VVPKSETPGEKKEGRKRIDRCSALKSRMPRERLTGAIRDTLRKEVKGRGVTPWEKKGRPTKGKKRKKKKKVANKPDSALAKTLVKTKET